MTTSRQLQCLLVAVALLLPTTSLAASDSAEFKGLLTGFSFDPGENLDTGPDTLAIFEHGRGSVSLGGDFKTSGTTAVVLRDVPSDGDFPELQGFFKEQREGRLWLHFNMLLTSTEHEMNVALAGPSGFGLKRDGISFWLTLRNDWLVHISDGIPKRLLRPTPFTWITVNAVLNQDTATYDLMIHQEGNEDPVVSLEDQPTAARHKNAAIDKFSFIGDRGNDTSTVEYWIDDVIVATEEPTHLPDFVAPGRRRTFVERLSALATAPSGQCPQILDQDDFEPKLADGSERSQVETSQAWEHWKEGCAALQRGDHKSALSHLSKAPSLVPESMAYAAGRVLALMANQQVDEAEVLLVELADRFQNDPRYPLVVARLAESNKDKDLAEEWLLYSIDSAQKSQEGNPLARDLALAGHYGLLLRQGLFDQAWKVADRLARQIADANGGEEVQPNEALWWERAGDAAFLHGATVDAEELYRFALVSNDQRSTKRLRLKLSDVLWSRGDTEGERELRERIYGRLD